MGAPKWTEAELTLLGLHYREMSCCELQQLLPDRSMSAIYAKSLVAGIRRSGVFWTVAELHILKECYPVSSREEMERHFPGRNWLAIARKASSLGISKRNCWTKTEDDVIRALYPTESRQNILKKLPSRNWTGITKRAQHLRVTRTGRYWTISEKENVRQYYPSLRQSEMEKLLPGRTWFSIQSAAAGMGISCMADRWSEDEKNSLALMVDHSTLEQISDRLGRTKMAIRRMLGIMGLSGRTVQPKTFCAAREKYAEECGWPTSLRLGSIKILNVLAETDKPLTKKEILFLLGRRQMAHAFQQLLDMDLLVRFDQPFKGPSRYILSLQAISVFKKGSSDDHPRAGPTGSNDLPAAVPTKRIQPASRARGHRRPSTGRVG